MGFVWGTDMSSNRNRVWVGRKVCLKELVPRSKLLGSNWDNTLVQPTVEVVEIIDQDTVRVSYGKKGIARVVSLSEIDFNCR